MKILNFILGWGKNANMMVIVGCLTICSISLNMYLLNKSCHCPDISCPTCIPCDIEEQARGLTYTPIPNMGQCMKGYNPFKMDRLTPAKADPGVRENFQNHQNRQQQKRSDPMFLDPTGSLASTLLDSGYNQNLKLSY